MNKLIQFKAKVIADCQLILTEKLDVLENELKLIAIDIAEDTKSSAGDKFETSREMANVEREKLLDQVAAAKGALGELNMLQHNSTEIVGLGSLIKTNKAWIFLAVSLGPIDVESEKVLVMSTVAPLAQLFMQKGVGDIIDFNRTKYEIISIC